MTSSPNTVTSTGGNVAAVLVCAAVVIRLFFPGWSSLAYWAAAAAMVWVLLYVGIERATIVRSLRRRRTTLSAAASFSVVAALFILLAVNFLAIRRDVTWDLSTNRYSGCRNRLGRYLTVSRRRSTHTSSPSRTGSRGSARS
jgi:hypothetical protein